MRRCFLVLTTLCAVALSADGRDAKWINQRIQRIKQSDSTAWKSIPWAASLSEARELSQKEQRPVFLFIHPTSEAVSLAGGLFLVAAELEPHGRQ